jgi:hypothetical protein
MKTKIYSIVLFALTLLSACGPTKVQNTCDIKDLLLDGTDFPEGTTLNDPSSPVDGYPAESADISASYRYDGMFQLAAQYSSAERAEREFTDNLRYFEEDSFGDSWKTPVEISYESPLAQKYHVACGSLSQGYQCRMIGQYNAYYVFFFAYITDDGITLESFENLLMKIDDHIAPCIQE